MERVKFLDSLKARIRNPFMLIGIIGAIYNFFIAAGIDASAMNSWPLLIDSLFGVLANPALLLSTISTLLGIYVDGSTPGITDKK